MEILRSNLFERPQEKLVSFLTLIFPIFFGVVSGWHSSIFMLIIVVSMTATFNKLRHFSGDEIKLFLYFMLLFSFSLLGLTNAQELYQGQKRLFRILYFLGFFPLILIAKTFFLNLSRFFLFGIAIGSIILAFVSVYQMEVAGIGRVGGATNPLVFGSIALLFAMIVVSKLISSRTSFVHGLLFGIATISALVASIFSLSRGVWIAFFPVLLFMIYLNRKEILARKAFIIFLLLALAGSFVMSSADDLVAARWQIAMQDLSTYRDGTNVNSSMGHRLFMWEVAWEKFLDHPLLGSGIGDFRHDLLARIGDDETQLAMDYNHSHSIYFEYLGMTGILGFSAMIVAVFILPFRFFWHQWRVLSKRSQGFPALAGMSVILCYAIFGLTECWLARSPMVIMYVICLSVFWSSCLVLRSEDHEGIC